MQTCLLYSRQPFRLLCFSVLVLLLAVLDAVTFILAFLAAFLAASLVIHFHFIVILVFLAIGLTLRAIYQCLPCLPLSTGESIFWAIPLMLSLRAGEKYQHLLL